MTRPIRVLFIAPHPVEGPSTRFRLVQFFDYLSRNGVECELRPFFTSSEARHIYRSGHTARKILLTLRATLRRMGDLARAGRYDVVYILREAFPFGPGIVERILHRRAGRMVFDFDDAIYLPSSAFQNPLDRLRDWTKPAALARSADFVLPGSAHLASFALQNGATESQLMILPTVVDPGIYCPIEVPSSGTDVVIGWIGTPRNTSYLRDMMPVFQRVAERCKQARFVFVGAEAFDTGSVAVEFREWSLENEVADLQSFDVGIMPLPSNDFEKGKCGFKLIEYMAVGVATVASPVGANIDIVLDGTTGFLAEGEDAWVTALARLTDDGALRRQMGASGRKRAQDHYSTDVVAPKLLEVLREVAKFADPTRQRAIDP